jgi:type IV pilus assembly protein PilN
VHFSSVKMTGKNIAIVGSAESNNRVSSLMRNLDGSDWLASPNLTEVKAVTSGGLDQANVFQLSVQQVQPAIAAEGVKQ